MKARAKWIEGMAFMGESGSGHAMVLDAPEQYEGRNLGMSPMEALLVGLAGCTGFDVVKILRKARQPVASLEVEALSERAAEDPKVFTAIELVYRISGRGLSRDAVERAVKLSKEKYCSASIMLGATAAITARIEMDDG